MSDNTAGVSAGAASASSASASKGKSDKRTALNDTSLHVFKGALVTVLGASASLTNSVEFVNKEQACLTIEWHGDGISEEQKLQIQDAANSIIQKNLPITHTPMDRKAAEAKYRAEPVNHTFIYDKFPVPEHVQQLKILQIENWNVNACSFEGHCKTTGELKALKILKQKRRANKNEYEFEFCVGEKAQQQLQKEGKTSSTVPSKPTAESSSSSSSSSALADSTHKSKSKKETHGIEPKHVEDWKALYRPTDVAQVSSDVLENAIAPFLQSLSASNDASALHALLSDEKKLKGLLLSKLQTSIEQRVQMFGNLQYTKGFQSKAYTQPSMHSLLNESRK